MYQGLQYNICIKVLVDFPSIRAFMNVIPECTHVDVGTALATGTCGAIHLLQSARTPLFVVH